MKLRITGIEYSERISDANLLDPGLEDLHIFPWSDGKRVNVGALGSVRGSDLPILSIRRYGAESLEDPHPGLHPSKDRVLVIKERRRSKGEEKLGT